jgi:hypothetical protein
MDVNLKKTRLEKLFHKISDSKHVLSAALKVQKAEVGTR